MLQTFSRFKHVAFLFLVVLFSFSTQSLFSQCEVEISSLIDSSVCGDCITLTAFGQGQGQQVFVEQFDNGNPSGWAFTQQATFTNPCSPNGVDGTTHIWMGDQSAVPRALETVDYDLTPATAGVTICFDMLFAEQGGAAPCEGPDEPDEGVYIQYSTDGGTTWNDIHYFDPNGGYDPDLINWNNWCFPVPQAAITPNTRFRWFQDADSGAEYDHWGIDNVNIYYNDPTYNITWQHDNYSYGVGNSGGDNPNQVCPQTTTTYYVEMTNGNSTCSDSIELLVVNPTLEVDAGNDTTICENECVLLNATAKVVKSPAKTPTYSNSQLQPITTGIGGNTDVNINVQGLNMGTILPGSITEVCIDNITFFGFNLFPPGQQTIGDLEINLICPDGTSITLIPNGVTTSTDPSEGYTNTCFTPVSTNNIANSTPNYTGDFIPGQPLDNFVGCTSNGVWTMQVTSTSPASFGSGFFSGWSITFDDPEISYDADFTWTPTANMTGANTLSPTVCPTDDQEYVLTASDFVGCVTLSDTILIQVDTVCCNLEFDANVQEPSCGNSDGSITINITQGSGNYDVSWSGGQNGLTINNIPAGTYTATIEDLDFSGCISDTTFTLSNPGAPAIDTAVAIAETCLGVNDGIAGIAVSGGTAPYTFTWDNSASSDSVLFNLSPGTYNVTVSDNNGCEATASMIVDPGPNCCDISVEFDITDPDCGQANGSIAVTVLNGSGNYDFSWQPSGTGNPLNNLSAGVYDLTVEDLDQVNCTLDTFATLTNPGAPTIDTAVAIAETCLGVNDGIAGIVVSGGTAPYSFAWDNSASTDSVLFNLSPGTYNVTVSDNSGCEATASMTVDPGPNCCDISVELDITDPDCGQANGSIAVTVLNGSGNYDFSWQPSGTGNPLNNLSAGVYDLTVEDLDQVNCILDTSIALSNPGAPRIDTAIAIAETCLGDNDGIAGIVVSGGTPPYSFLWNNNATDSVLFNLAPGNYTVEVTDANGCEANAGLTVDPGPLCCDLTASTIMQETNCGTADGSIEIVVDSSTADLPLSFSIDGNAFGNNPIFGNLSAGNYTLYVEDAAGCVDTLSETVTEANNTIVLNLSSNPISCFNSNDGVVTAEATTANPPLQYNWSTSSTDTFIENLSEGIYWVEVSDQNNCSRTDTVELINPEALTVNLGGTIVLCFGESETLDAGNFETYIWSTGDSSQSIEVTSSGSYAVTVSDANGCLAADSVNANIGDSLIVDAGQDTSIIEFNSAQLQGLINGSDNPSGQYIWSPEFLLDCDDCLNPTVSPMETQEFVLTYTDANNCTQSDTVLVEVLEGEYYLYMPTAFSPNGDGINDFYAPIHKGVDRWVFEVYDRWGELLYESRNLTDEWDGTYKGKKLNPGVYVYRIYAEFINLETINRKGSLTIVR